MLVVVHTKDNNPEEAYKEEAILVTWDFLLRVVALRLSGLTGVPSAFLRYFTTQTKWVLPTLWLLLAELRVLAHQVSSKVNKFVISCGTDNLGRCSPVLPRKSNIVLWRRRSHLQQGIHSMCNRSVCVKPISWCRETEPISLSKALLLPQSPVNGVSIAPSTLS